MLEIGYGLCHPAVPSKKYLFSPYWSAEAAAGPTFSPAGFPAIQEARQSFFLFMFPPRIRPRLQGGSLLSKKKQTNNIRKILFIYAGNMQIMQ